MVLNQKGMAKFFNKFNGGKPIKWFFVKNAGKIFFLFLVSYAIIYMLSVFTGLTGFGGWNLSADISRIDYFFALAPIVGFFFMFFLVDWIEGYFDTKFTRTAWFAVLIIAMSVVAYYVAVFWLYCNLFSMQQVTFCSPLGASQTSSYLSSQTPNNNLIANFLSDLPIDFLGKIFGSMLRTQFSASFFSSPYIVLVLGALFGWAARLLSDKLPK